MLVFCLADPKVIGGGHERRQKTRPQPGRSTRDGGWQCEARTAKHGNLLTTERVCWHRGAHTAKQKLVRILITKIPPILITKTNVVFCGTWPGELLRRAFFKTVPLLWRETSTLCAAMFALPSVAGAVAAVATCKAKHRFLVPNSINSNCCGPGGCGKSCASCDTGACEGHFGRHSGPLSPCLGPTGCS